jgi:Radical SAM superfamily
MSGAWARWAAAWRLLREPVPAEKRRLLAERWRALDPRWRTPLQGFGRQATGCGATLGLAPRCDFDCRGCYLGAGANAVPPLPRAEVLAQLDRLRAWLGPKGNVQITDGEVTLLPAEELIAVVRHARAIGLSPMVMTHGDSFRRRPELLTRLVAEGGLREVAIHVDATQRGRRGVREGASEEELMPLREEFAALVRRVRRETGVRLRAATTLTVARGNLAGVGAVIAWCLANRDAFGLVSLQPLAQVGRTRLREGVGVEELWRTVATALAPFGAPLGEPLGVRAAGRRGPLAFGHPDCSRVEPFLVVQRKGGPPRPLPLVRPGHAGDEALASDFFARGLGGLNFRDDSPAERACRTVGALARHPRWFAGPLRRWAAERAAEAGTTLPRLAWALATGAARLDSFTVVSHHFMSPAELATETGRERLAACVFRLAVDGEMVPMCRVNAGGVRAAAYSRAAAATAAARRSSDGQRGIEVPGVGVAHLDAAGGEVVVPAAIDGGGGLGVAP